MVNQSDNLAVVLHGPNQMKLENIPLPVPPGPDDVQVKSEFCGICGTDIHLLKNAKIGTFSVEKPLVLGHEGSGTVVAVGKNVSTLAVGDRVTIENAVPCMKCKVCLKGNYNFCETCTRQAKGLPPADGLLARFYNHPAAFTHKVPDSVSLEVAALAEPLAVSVHALNRVALSFGQNVLICGAGTMGLLTMVCAKAYGAAQVCIVDIVQEKLDVAKKFGADHTVLSVKGKSTEEMAKQVIDKMGGMVDVTIEATGSEFCLGVSILATSYGGKIGLIGLGSEKVAVPLSKAILKEIDLLGVCRYRNSYQQAVNLLASRSEFKEFITNVFPIEKATDAFEAMKKGADIKILIKCSTKWTFCN